MIAPAARDVGGEGAPVAVAARVAAAPGVVVGGLTLCAAATVYAACGLAGGLRGAAARAPGVVAAEWTVVVAVMWAQLRAARAGPERGTRTYAAACSCCLAVLTGGSRRAGVAPRAPPPRARVRASPARGFPHWRGRVNACVRGGAVAGARHTHTRELICLCASTGEAALTSPRARAVALVVESAVLGTDSSTQYASLLSLLLV